MTEIDVLRARVSQVQRSLSTELARSSDSAESVKDTLLRLEAAFAQAQEDLAAHKSEIHQAREENRQLRQLLDGLLETIENSGAYPVHDTLEDLGAITGRLGRILDGKGPEQDARGARRQVASPAPLSDLPRKTSGARAPRLLENGADQGRPAKIAEARPGPPKGERPARAERPRPKTAGTDELSLRAIAELWSHETGQSKIAIMAELIAAFQELIGDKIGKVTGDTTITRENLRKFCADVNIAPPNIWAQFEARA